MAGKSKQKNSTRKAAYAKYRSEERASVSKAKKIMRFVKKTQKTLEDRKSLLKKLTNSYNTSRLNKAVVLSTLKKLESKLA
jgi:hypothetical protein